VSSFLSDATMGLMAVAATVLLSLLSYVVTLRFTNPAGREKHRDMANAMVARIAALHGLILALVFAQEMAAYQRLEVQTASEASAVADVYNDARRYDAVALQPVSDAIVGYLRVVVDEEWSGLGRGQGLSPEAWTAWSTAYETVLDLVPATPRQTSLRDHMLQSLHAISSSRDMRHAEADSSLAGLFWLAAVAGVILIAAGHYIHPLERHNVVLLVMFSAYTGGILFLIYGFSNPFNPPAQMQPAPLIDLLGLIGR